MFALLSIGELFEDQKHKLNHNKPNHLVTFLEFS